jgi:hypothetical protein
MGNVLYLKAKNSLEVGAKAHRDLRDAARVATEAAHQIFALAVALEANIDLVDRIVDQVDDPFCREASRKQTAKTATC